MALKNKKVTLPELMLIAGTRVVLGIGIGLLIADFFTPQARVGAGWALVIVGALVTIPLLLEVFHKQ